MGENQFTNPWIEEQLLLLSEVYPNPDISKKDIEKIFNRNFPSITKKANAIKLRRKYKHTSRYSLKITKEKIKKRYEKGESEIELAKRCDCSATRIQCILKSEGTKIRTLSESAKLYIAKNPNEKKRLLELRMNQVLPKTDTTIELKVKDQLGKWGIYFFHPFNLGDRFQCDFYIPSLNLIIECDGDYWHSREDMKRRDKAKDAYAKKCGYAVVRIKEHTIKEKSFDVYNIIEKASPEAFRSECEWIGGCGLHPVRCLITSHEGV